MENKKLKKVTYELPEEIIGMLEDLVPEAERDGFVRDAIKQKVTEKKAKSLLMKVTKKKRLKALEDIFEYSKSLPKLTDAEIDKAIRHGRR